MDAARRLRAMLCGAQKWQAAWRWHVPERGPFGILRVERGHVARALAERVGGRGGGNGARFSGSLLPWLYTSAGHGGLCVRRRLPRQRGAPAPRPHALQWSQRYDRNTRPCECCHTRRHPPRAHLRGRFLGSTRRRLDWRGAVVEETRRLERRGDALARPVVEGSTRIPRRRLGRHVARAAGPTRQSSGGKRGVLAGGVASACDPQMRSRHRVQGVKGRMVLEYSPMLCDFSTGRWWMGEDIGRRSGVDVRKVLLSRTRSVCRRRRSASLEYPLSTP